MVSFEEQRHLLKTALEASVAAGAQIMQVYGQGAFAVESKDDNSPLTEADRRAHAIIMAVLSDTDIPVLSEEGAEVPFESRAGWSRLWIVDPLDGTKEFIKRNGEFTVNIALIENGEPVLGVVYVPVHNKSYLGAPDLGAWSCREPQRLLDEWDGEWNEVADRMPHPDLAENRPFRVVASRSHNSPETEAFIEEQRATHPDLELTSIGSSLKICLIAEGSADVYPRFAPTMEWDTAAGHAVLKAAGKELFDHSTGNPMVYNRIHLRNNWFIAQ
jgi:3'(2'), 5'-bisphosphate nucleotidase